MLYIDFITFLPCDIAHYKPYTLIYITIQERLENTFM